MSDEGLPPTEPITQLEKEHREIREEREREEQVRKKEKDAWNILVGVATVAGYGLGISLAALGLGTMGLVICAATTVGLASAAKSY